MNGNESLARQASWTLLITNICVCFVSSKNRVLWQTRERESSTAFSYAHKRRVVEKARKHIRGTRYFVLVCNEPGADSLRTPLLLTSSLV
jgi:hypothetical protein